MNKAMFTNKLEVMPEGSHYSGGEVSVLLERFAPFALHVSITAIARTVIRPSANHRRELD